MLLNISIFVFICLFHCGYASINKVKDFRSFIKNITYTVPSIIDSSQCLNISQHIRDKTYICIDFEKIKNQKNITKDIIQQETDFIEYVTDFMADTYNDNVLILETIKSMIKDWNKSIFLKYLNSLIFNYWNQYKEKIDKIVYLWLEIVKYGVNKNMSVDTDKFNFFIGNLEVFYISKKYNIQENNCLEKMIIFENKTCLTLETQPYYDYYLTLSKKFD